jgi:release factor glutamine methyltransferase
VHPDALIALIALGRLLRERRYRFTTITPASHARVVARPAPARASVRDVLGWSRPFARGTIDVEVERLLDDAGVLQEQPNGLVRARVRASTLDDALYVHSAFPTDDVDAVFFGPDTYRYVALLRRWLADADVAGKRVVDVGAGSGAGGLSLAHVAREVVLADVNEAALALCDVNARINDIRNVRVVHSDVLAAVDGAIDLVVANPPYLVDARERAYRHGGARGIALSLRILDEALTRLSPGGRCVIYTGSPVVNGASLFVDGACEIVARHSSRARVERVEELDPDVFGEELDAPAYADVERIALVGLLARRGL